MLRPLPARWFEVLAVQDDAAPVLEALASSGAIELETRPMDAVLVPVAGLKELLERYAELARAYQSYWRPAAASRPRVLTASPRELLALSLERLDAWREVADPVVRTLQSLEQEAGELRVWREIFRRFRWSPLDFGLVSASVDQLGRFLYLFPRETDFTVPADALGVRFLLQQELCVLMVAPQSERDALHRQALAFKGRLVAIPSWFEGAAPENLPRAERRLVQAEAGMARLRATLAEINDCHDLAGVLADVAMLAWFSREVKSLPASDNFVLISGWTSDLSGDALGAALAAVSARALLHFPAPPAHSHPPLVLRNPAWARPFEIFARALGVPARHEVDPSPLLAFIVPLLFGYMFADVGQGAVLLIAGLWAQRRWPIARLLVAGGASAMIFGALFGSTFSREDWLPALWLHPLAEPLTVLGVPLVLGAALLALGLVLGGLEAYWRGAWRDWLAAEAGLLVAYVAAVLGMRHPASFMLAGLGLLWYVAGHVRHEPTGAGLGRALGSVVEHAFQLAVNTLSFTRVGAFALAHAGLSSAVVALADSTGHWAGAAVVMLLGNVVIIVLEALVVSVQTTRLVLFEFFIRFLRGEGRVLRPLPVPPSTLARRIA